MILKRLDNQTGGIALALGYTLYALALFRDPANGMETATATMQGILFFVLFPLLGFVSGLYSYHGGPFHVGLAVVTASYLGAVGITLTLLLRNLPLSVTILGICLFGLGTVALVGTLSSAFPSLRLTDFSFGMD